MAQPWRILQVSDLHLNPDKPEHMARLERVVRAAADAGPDLIVASGDLTDDGYLYEGMNDAVRALMGQMPAPVVWVPGNHDVGNKASVQEQSVEQSWMDRWFDSFSYDRFVESRPGWTAIGLNSQTAGSGLPCEDEQWEWLQAQLDAARDRRDRVAIFTHCPLYLHRVDEPTTGGYRYWTWDHEPRQRLVRMLEGVDLALLANGHVHWYRAVQRGQTLHTWCPSLSVAVDDPLFPRGGDCLGMVLFELGEKGVHHRLVTLPSSGPRVLLRRVELEKGDGTSVLMAELVIDVRGALGEQIDALAEQLESLTHIARVTLLTGSQTQLSAQIESLALDIRRVNPNQRSAFVRGLGAEQTVAICDGEGSDPVLRAAGLGLAVVPPGQRTPEHADLQVGTLGEALSVLQDPARMRAIK